TDVAAAPGAPDARDPSASGAGLAADRCALCPGMVGGSSPARRDQPAAILSKSAAAVSGPLSVSCPATSYRPLTSLLRAQPQVDRTRSASTTRRSPRRSGATRRLKSSLDRPSPG